jgi:hypothetical protein
MRASLHTVTTLLQEGRWRNGPSVAESLFTRAFRGMRYVVRPHHAAFRFRLG